jgi:hypothetical protein
MEFTSKLIRNRVFIAVFLFLVSFAVYSPSLKNDFVWDDVEVITKGNVSFDASVIYRSIVPKATDSKAPRYYRPVLYASLVADQGLWGVSSFGYHLSNIIFNSVSVVVFYFMALLILGEFGIAARDWAAPLSSLLFILHPIHVESVSWIAGRTDVLCGLFIFLAFTSHILSYRSLWFLSLTGLSFILSLFSKEVAVVFPVLVLMFDLINRRLFERANIIRYAVYIIIIALYLYLRGRAFVNLPEMAVSDIADEGMRTAGRINIHIERIPDYLGLLKILLASYLTYLNKLILPAGLNAFITSVPVHIAYIASSVVFLAALCVLSLISVIRRENVTAFSILWILIALGPSALVAVFSIASTPLAERYLYIPSAGFCLLAGYWIAEAAAMTRFRWLALGFVLVLLVWYGSTNYIRQRVWRNDLALWRDTSVKSPYHPIPRANYGLALSNAGDTENAIREFRIALSPEMRDTPRGKAVTANNLGIVYLETGDYPEAEKWLVRALEYDPGYGRTYYHLGLIYYIKGELTGKIDNYEKAESYLRRALSRYYHYGRANLILAKIYLKTGQRERADEEARAALRSGLPEHLEREARDILEIDDAGGNKKPK